MSIKLGEKSTSHLPLPPPPAPQKWISNPLLPGGEPLQLYLFSHLWVIYPGVWVLTIPHLCPSYSFCYGSFLFLKKIYDDDIGILFFFGHAAHGILVPWPGMESESPVSKVWNLNHWTTREFPCGSFFISLDVEDLLCWSSGLPHL